MNLTSGCNSHNNVSLGWLDAGKNVTASFWPRVAYPVILWVTLLTLIPVIGLFTHGILSGVIFLTRRLRKGCDFLIALNLPLHAVYCGSLWFTTALPLFFHAHQGTIPETYCSTTNFFVMFMTITTSILEVFTAILCLIGLIMPRFYAFFSADWLVYSEASFAVLCGFITALLPSLKVGAIYELHSGMCRVVAQPLTSKVFVVLVAVAMDTTIGTLSGFLVIVGVAVVMGRSRRSRRVRALGPNGPRQMVVARRHWVLAKMLAVTFSGKIALLGAISGVADHYWAKNQDAFPDAFVVWSRIAVATQCCFVPVSSATIFEWITKTNSLTFNYRQMPRTVKLN